MSISSFFEQLKPDAAGATWPTALTGQTATLFSALYALDRTERLPRDDLDRLQGAEIEQLVRHAATKAPFYEERLRRAGYRAGKTSARDVWDAIPVLTRSDIQDHADRLRAKSYPAWHGAIKERSTSGSTSRPVRVVSTDYCSFRWQCINLRDRLWHGIDLSETLVQLTDGADRMNGRPVVELGSWSVASTSLRRPGKQFKINPSLPIGDQVRAIRKIDPAYLHTRPSQLNLLLKECETSGERFGKLRAVFCLSEIVTDALRQLCRERYGVEILDCYSCAEIGYLALQCPTAGRYHVQSEFVRVEILKPNGSPCAPGEIGRVIVTDLKNYAMPLIRYEIGDEAEVGAPCACGRSLPVIERIVGRTQDYVRLRSGATVRADIKHYAIARMPAILEFQIVQPALGRLDLHVVTRRPLDEDETSRLKALVAQQGPETFEVEIIRRDAIERPASGKLRTFVCSIA